MIAINIKINLISIKGNQVPLVKIIRVFIFKRFMMATGTKLSFAEKLAAQRIAQVHKMSLSNQTDKSHEEFLNMMEQALNVQPKVAQHMLTVLYPRKVIPLSIFEKRYPNISLIDKNHNGFADINDTIATIQGAQLKEQAFYQHTQMRVLLNPNKPSCKYNQIAYAQTGQKNPDYHVSYKNEWQRYQDYKTGQYNINSGHVYISHPEEFEVRIKIMLYAQRNYYQHDPIIKKAFTDILSDENLSFRERNIKIQVFFLENLQKLPNINPSLIFERQPNYDLDNRKVLKIYDATIHGETCLLDLQTSEKTLAHTILAGGKKSTNNYMNDPDANPNIIALIRENIRNSSEEVD